MNQFVESLKRLYENKKVNGETIARLYEAGKISVEEKKYILNDINS